MDQIAAILSYVLIHSNMFEGLWVYFYVLLPFLAGLYKCTERVIALRLAPGLSLEALAGLDLSKCYKVFTLKFFI